LNANGDSAMGLFFCQKRRVVAGAMGQDVVSIVLVVVETDLFVKS
jgi:hypothetical protein